MLLLLFITSSYHIKTVLIWFSLSNVVNTSKAASHCYCALYRWKGFCVVIFITGNLSISVITAPFSSHVNKQVQALYWNITPTLVDDSFLFHSMNYRSAISPISQKKTFFFCFFFSFLLCNQVQFKSSVAGNIIPLSSQEAASKLTISPLALATLLTNFLLFYYKFCSCWLSAVQLTSSHWIQSFLGDIILNSNILKPRPKVVRGVKP